MFRYRRYRVFLVFAVLTVLAFYHFSGSGTWETALPSDAPELAQEPETALEPSEPALPAAEVAKETRKLEFDITAADTRPTVTPPPVNPINRPTQKAPPAPLVQSKPPTNPIDTIPKPAPVGHGHWDEGSYRDAVDAPEDAILKEHGEGRLEIAPLPSTVQPIHWVPQSEHFPVPSDSTIQLPSGTPKPMPRIQYDFKEETPEERVDREGKLRSVKDAFMHAWSGYKRHAWMQDELSPLTGKSRNPFAGWGATLVDSLDTLYIMDLKEEFDEAAKAVADIDFTTTVRSDIPLFETTIRYLGGLLAAYDLSEKRYKSLLDKAVELAEILMGAFDTPNRMPEMYYYWKPTFASQPHRASTRVVLAEIGSLSMEFTRLAQLTREPKYYDAVARITDMFDEWQSNTRLPGMWPVHVDASGCKKPEHTTAATVDFPKKGLPLLSDASGITFDLAPNTLKGNGETLRIPAEDEAEDMVPLKKPEALQFVPGKASKGRIQGWDDQGEVNDPAAKHQIGSPSSNVKRQLEASSPMSLDAEVSASPHSSPLATPECIPQGFTAPEFGSQQYTLGGMSDSTYEYLIKQYLLLGGLVDKYRTMYEKSMDTASKYLLFRPMVPGDHDILMSGSYTLTPKGDEMIAKLEPENAHLTCFAGGMFAMGAKLLDRKEDLEIGAKLTEGCVWAYNATNTGIMPEAYLAVPCDSRAECTWNETKYWDLLDPWAENRANSYKQQLEVYEREMATLTRKKAEAANLAAKAEKTEAVVTPTAEVEAPRASVSHSESLKMRQLDEPAVLVGPPSRTMKEELPEKPLFSPEPPLTQEEYVKQKAELERLPAGFTQFKSRKYILRPEAIESVFYMYRITGDSHWRKVGWRMFMAIQKQTQTEFGNSAIDDVTKPAPQLLDEMESFWLAETLKYFYLLFADENVISLDDFVFNTEAHPFRRPK